MHELEVLLSRLKMEHLSYHVESLLEQAAKKELNYREFLCMALQQEWNGRHQRGMESRLKQARLPWVKSKRLVRTVLIFTESSDQLSRATDRVPGLPASPGYVQ